MATYIPPRHCREYSVSTVADTDSSPFGSLTDTGLLEELAAGNFEEDSVVRASNLMATQRDFF